MGLAKIIQEPELLKRKAKYLYASFALTGGMALLFALLPSLFFPSYISANEKAQLGQAFAANPAVGDAIMANLSEMRKTIFVADAWRSFAVVLTGFALLLAYRYKKLKAAPMTIALAALCIIDMYSVNKRYLNDNNFVEEQHNEQSFAKTAADEMILHDKSLDYRVLNLARNTFNENETAYYHKSIGGYHPAKLGRYQDLINACIVPEIQRISNEVGTHKSIAEIDFSKVSPVLNMLNCKYFIFPVGNGQEAAFTNTAAYGNAWFVDKIQFVKTPNEELNALKQIDPRTIAVADIRYQATLAKADNSTSDSTSTIKLVKYEADELHYETSSATGGIALFSEIYYPGWKATIDGKPLELGRADYVLRAAYVPAGKHKICMTFKPASVKATETVAYAALILIALGFIYAMVKTLHAGKQTTNRHKN